MAQKKRRTTTMTKRKRRVARGGSMRGKKKGSQKPWYAEHVGKVIAGGVGLALIAFPDPIPFVPTSPLSVLGYGILASTFAVAGIQAASK